MSFTTGTISCNRFLFLEFCVDATKTKLPQLEQFPVTASCFLCVDATKTKLPQLEQFPVTTSCFLCVDATKNKITLTGVVE